MTHKIHHIRHIDLFSGIGGFALAADRVFGEVEHIFCDNEPFAQEVLNKHWPNSKIYGDIRTLTADTYSNGCSGGHQKIDSTVTNEQTLGDSERCTKSPSVFLLTGGFPCQPFSQAGKRKGTDDNRYLWPEMLRVIQEFQPTWVIAENVRGLLSINGGLVFEQVCTDLESAGYEVQPIVIPAVAVNAPHRRDRVWFVAHKRSAGLQETWAEQQTAGTRGEGGNGRTGWDKDWPEVATAFCRVDDGVSDIVDRNRIIEYISQYDNKRALEILKEDTEGNPVTTMRLLRLYVQIAEASLYGASPMVEGESIVPTVPHKRGLKNGKVGSWSKEKQKMRDLQSLVSSKDTRKNVENLLSEMPLDIREAQRIIAVASQRNARLKALGNAIVPQVAEEIMRAIKSTYSL